MFPIRVLSQQTGIPPSTIRYYESIGLLPAPNRSNNGYRQYTADAIDRLMFIKHARQIGLSLAEISTILTFRKQHEPPCNYVADQIAHQLDAVQAQINRLIQQQAILETLLQIGRQLPASPEMQGCICALIRDAHPIPDSEE